MAGKKVAVIEYLKANPGHTWEQYRESGGTVSNPYFYKIRRALGNVKSESDLVSSDILAGIRVFSKSKEKYTILAKYFFDHQSATYDQVVKGSGVDIDGSTWSRLKLKLLRAWKKVKVHQGTAPVAPEKVDRRRGPRGPRNSLYMRVFSMPTPSVEAKTVLKSFIDTLKNAKVANYEMVEYADPKMIEVRETR